MDKDELKKKNQFYKDHVNMWTFWETAYEGADAFIEMVIKQHPRETNANWLTRKEEAMVFNFAESIVDLFNFYLTEKAPIRDLGVLSNDPLWQMFQKDCDLNGTNFDVFLNEKQKVAAIFGFVGILVDKPPGIRTTKQEEIEGAIYPYCAAYTPLNILDWKLSRNRDTSRYDLVFLKLLDSDGKYFLWEPDKWKIWEIEKLENGDEGEAVLFDEGENPLNEIPFFWMINIQSAIDPYFGVSDIKEISKIQASITRNISCGEEVINYAGFPQARRPKLLEGESDNNVSGITPILEFDPELGDAGKPDWLEAACAEPIESIIKWIAMKSAAIYDMKHISGIHATAQSKEARSGAALRAEFQQLNSVLVKKNENLTEAELRIIQLWTKWQNQKDFFKKVNITRPKEFSIDDLSISLENTFKAMKIVLSDKFARLGMKNVVKKSMPDMLDGDRNLVNKEIDDATIDMNELRGVKLDKEI